MKISEITRAELCEALATSGQRLTGKLDDFEFLQRLYDLDKLPSTDSRVEHMAADVHLHCVHFAGDWPDDWMFHDSRLNLEKDEVLLRFLVELLHPRLRRPKEANEELRKLMNAHLRVDGWEIVENGLEDNRPVYRAQACSNHKHIPAEQNILERLGSHVARQAARMQRSEGDPEAVIGAAKDLVETVARTILQARGMSYDKSDEVPKLSKRAIESIGIVPAHFGKGPNERDALSSSLQMLLKSLGNISHALAELRNHSGTGHGRGADFVALGPAYANLARNSALAYAYFLCETSDLAQLPIAQPDES